MTDVAAARIVVTSAPPVAVTQSVTVRPAGRTWLVRAEWTPEDLLNFVELQVASRFDLPEMERVRAYAIVRRYVKEWGGDLAAVVARYAFDPLGADGFWCSAPITLTQFCKNSDRHFTLPILRRIDAAATQAEEFARR